MAEPNPDPDPDAEIADASLLFGVAPAVPRPPTAEPSDSSAGEGYDVAGFDPGPETAPAAPVPPIPPPRPRTTEATRKPKPVAREASSGVGQVWSRGAEWGGSLVRVGLGLVGAGTLLYATFNLDALFVWSLVLLASMIVLLVLAYPIFITLERPVRMTPEQAVKDYFGAFSHLVPHTKRMWLLLATDGRSSPSFGAYGEFETYWRGKVAAWKTDASLTAPLNPFEIEVIDFKSDKSAGQTELDATYTARVIKRGQPGEAIATYNIALRLVRGSDKMWYLNSGTLP
jgi:hypothetical protein